MSKPPRQLGLFEHVALAAKAEGASARPSPRRCGPQSTPTTGSLAREDYVALMPEPAFQVWVRERLRRAAKSADALRRERDAVEADRRLRAWAARRHGAGQGASESPLEASLLRAFFDAGFRPLAALSEIVVGRSAHGLLLQQLPVSTPAARYRLDFALMHPANGVFLAIEVDGREFHDRTAEQGRRDRQRDRSLSSTRSGDSRRSTAREPKRRQSNPKPARDRSGAAWTMEAKTRRVRRPLTRPRTSATSARSGSCCKAWPRSSASGAPTCGATSHGRSRSSMRLVPSDSLSSWPRRKHAVPNERSARLTRAEQQPAVQYPHPYPQRLRRPLPDSRFGAFPWSGTRGSNP